MQVTAPGGNVTETSSETYDRGVAAGEILGRLAGHDAHFAQINGSMGRIAEEMHSLVLQVQRLGDAAESDRNTVIKTASALKEANENRIGRSEQQWTPVMRLLAVVSALSAALSAVAVVLVLLHG